ncbi:FkbM family methyltransferase [Candidatus Nomurabacteria bacterium]|nr:FkbM family methyltransferase [Candidatus Nomurabacteria bacterium]
MPSDRTISIIHIDVEGFEEKALLGASKIISRDKPLIISEVREGMTNKIMDKFGYKFHLGLEEKTWVEGYRNAVFKHKDSN